MNDGSDNEQAPRPLLQRYGAILWPSFFAAGVATMVFFALVDPDELREITWAELELSREGGYTIGFFMFWLCTAASSTFTWLLLSSNNHANKEALSPSPSPTLPEHRGGSKQSSFESRPKKSTARRRCFRRSGLSRFAQPPFGLYLNFWPLTETPAIRPPLTMVNTATPFW